MKAVTLDGTLVGTSGLGAAAFGDISNNLFAALPGFDDFVARDITDDGAFVVGHDYIWKHNDLTGYQVLTPNNSIFL